MYDAIGLNSTSYFSDAKLDNRRMVTHNDWKINSCKGIRVNLEIYMAYYTAGFDDEIIHKRQSFLVDLNFSDNYFSPFNYLTMNNYGW